VNSRITGPRSVGFGTVQRAKGGERLVSLERRDGLDGIPIAALRYDKSRLQVLPRKVHERRTELILKVLPGAPPGAFSTLLEVVLDDPAQRRVLIPVYGYVEPSLRTTPALLLLPKQAKPGATLGSLSLNAEVLKVEAPAGIEAQQKGRQITLFAKGKLPTADAWLVLHTKTAGEERVRVRLVVRD